MIVTCQLRVLCEKLSELLPNLDAHKAASNNTFILSFLSYNTVQLISVLTQICKSLCHRIFLTFEYHFLMSDLS